MTKLKYQARASATRKASSIHSGGLPESKLALNYAFENPVYQKLFRLFQRRIEGLLCLPQLNGVYEIAVRDCGCDLFIDKVIRAVKADYQVSHRDLTRIPRNGSVVVVANHPFGAIEGLILMSILCSKRPDAKLMANFLLHRIEELRDLLICVDPFEREESKRENIKPLKQSVRWLKAGHMLAVFPAGEVSHVRLSSRDISDPPWSNTIARIVRKTRASVLPVFFSGINSTLFQLFGLIHSRIRTALLPHEFLNKRGRNVGLRIGNVIPFSSLSHLPTDEQITSYLRDRTYLLRYRETRSLLRQSISPTGSVMDDKTPRRVTGRTWLSGCIELPAFAKKHRAEPIIRTCQSAMLIDEVKGLPEKQVLITEGDYTIFHASSVEIPYLLREIGRLRELTFRQVGEGTGECVDIDRFDSYYQHLCIWNNVANELVGAYRIGRSDRILLRFGKKGLYTSSLFNYQPAMLSKLQNGLELGRSFVKAKYQRSYQPLFYLWRGIAKYVAQHPEYFILFGSVSISNRYQTISKLLMLEFFRQNHFHQLAGFVSPKKPFRFRAGRSSAASVVPMIKNVTELSSVVSDIEVDSKDIPLLLKQYLRLGGRLLGFNVDPKFGNTLDGLIMVDLRTVPANILSRYMGKSGAGRFLTYHFEGPPPPPRRVMPPSREQMF